MRQTALARPAVLALLLAAGTALASPDPGRADADPIGQLLVERALTPPAPTPDAQTEPAPMLQRLRDRGSELVVGAMAFLGVPYRRGGTGGAGFDCSGFTRHIFENSIGLVLPRRADDQAHAAGVTPIKRDELRPGDLVFFNTLKRTFSHVGIYIGDGKFIHSPRAGGAVRIEDMRIAYWQHRFTGARRVDAVQRPAGSLADPATAPTLR
jgi:cell wall-associated NlpC family hydrolase